MFQRNGVWTFSIHGVLVFVRELPRNNITVYHQFSPPVREVVEPICTGRGHWRSEFKNWLVFEQFKGVVLDELEQIARG